MENWECNWVERRLWLVFSYGQVPGYKSLQGTVARDIAAWAEAEAERDGNVIQQLQFQHGSLNYRPPDGNHPGNLEATHCACTCAIVIMCRISKGKVVLDNMSRPSIQSHVCLYKKRREILYEQKRKPGTQVQLGAKEWQ